MAMTNAERQARHRERCAAEKPVVVRYRRPADRRGKPQQWADAVDTLLGILDAYEAWRDSMPAGLDASATAERLDAILEMRELVEQLQAVELPKGFGRDT